MTESEYIWISNKTALMCLLCCAGEIQAGKEYGIPDEKKWKDAYKAIGEITRDIFKNLPEIDEED